MNAINEAHVTATEPISHDMFFSALGFMAVVMKDEALEQQAQRARHIAQLIRSFCENEVREIKTLESRASQDSVPQDIAPKHCAPKHCAPQDFASQDFAQKPSPSPEVKDQFSVANHMASVIAAIIQSDGECFPDLLRDKGFTAAEITRHWKVAYALACVALNRDPRDS